MESIKLIYKKFPAVEKAIKKPNDPKVSLSTQEAVFVQMVQFFKEPSVHQFSMNMLYEHLKDEDLLLALEATIVFFQKDTFLVKKVEQSFYSHQLTNEQIVGQKHFSTLVEGAIEGISFPTSMIHMYWKRNSPRVPKPDLIITKTPYWFMTTVEKFIKEEKKRFNSKK